MHRAPSSRDKDTSWLNAPSHRDRLKADALRQFEFFRASPDPAGGFHVLEALMHKSREGFMS
ncbi:hypothetical protein GC173_16530 [bacterium]|nr:hypothetical protein [bacterium]